MKKYYNVHGLISFSIEGSEKSIEYLCSQCNYFVSDETIEHEDIVIKIGAFESLVDQKCSYHIINRKYYVGENAVFANDMYKTARWRMQIEDLDGEQTRFYFDGNGWTKYILHKSFVEALLRYKLNQKGYLMVHSSATYIKEGMVGGVVFAASPEAGKTSTMLNYLDVGNGFMADDFSLLGSGNVYAYPTPITLHSHNLKRHSFLKNALNASDKWEIAWRTMVLKLTMGMGDISYKVDIWNKLPECSVAACVPLSHLVLLTKWSGETVKYNKITKAMMIEKLLIVNYYETILFNGYLKAYEYVNLMRFEDSFWHKMRQNIENILTETEYDEIFLPCQYSEQVFRDVDNIVKIGMRDNTALTKLSQKIGGGGI